MAPGWRQWANQVDMDSVEAVRGRRYGLQGRAGMAVDLGGLTRETGASPLLDVPPHSRPHRSPADEAVCPQAAGMVEGVVVGEDLAPVLAWDVWACRATGDITPQL